MQVIQGSPPCRSSHPLHCASTVFLSFMRSRT
nr:MAG TPA_asm: hypothetical protein [Bacteriophage sp.]DAX95339.1 MAG TPA: hypothetical protein [Caudoviricetes sp.]